MSPSIRLTGVCLRDGGKITSNREPARPPRQAAFSVEHCKKRHLLRCERRFAPDLPFRAACFSTRRCYRAGCYISFLSCFSFPSTKRTTRRHSLRLLLPLCFLSPRVFCRRFPSSTTRTVTEYAKSPFLRERRRICGADRWKATTRVPLPLDRWWRMYQAKQREQQQQRHFASSPPRRFGNCCYCCFCGFSSFLFVPCFYPGEIGSLAVAIPWCFVLCVFRVK